MRTDRDAFMAAILAAPDDDLPRLVFADWLDEHGEPERAEFIRVQCELARLVGEYNQDVDPVHHFGSLLVVGYSQHDPLIAHHRRAVERINDAPTKPHALRQREREFLAYPWFDWLPSLTGGNKSWEGRVSHGQWGSIDVGQSRIKCAFSRGFPARITCTWADWCRHAARISAACPIRNAADACVMLTTWPPEQELLDITSRGNPWPNMQDQVAVTLDYRWPGVRFELPREPQYGPYVTLEETERMFEPAAGTPAPSR